MSYWAANSEKKTCWEVFCLKQKPNTPLLRSKYTKTPPPRAFPEFCWTLQPISPPQILLVKKKQVHIRYTIYLSTRTVRTIPVSEILGSCPVPHLSKLEPNDAPPNSRPARQVDSKYSYGKRRKTSWKGSMAIRHLLLVLVYHGPLEIATFWELRHLLSLGCNIFEIFIMLYVSKKLSCQTFNHFNCTCGTFLGDKLQDFSMSHGASG